MCFRIDKKKAFKLPYPPIVIIVNKLYEPNDGGKPAIRKMTHVSRETFSYVVLQLRRERQGARVGMQMLVC